MKHRRKQFAAPLIKYVLPALVIVGSGIVGTLLLANSHAATTTPSLFVTPASGTYQPGTKFNVSVEVNWDSQYFENVGAVFHLEGPIQFVSGSAVAQKGSGDYSCLGGFQCDLTTGTILGSQYSANEMEISEYIQGEGFPNVPTTTGTFLVFTLHLQATGGSGIGRVVIDPDYSYGYNDVYYPDASTPNPYKYSSVEPTLQSGSYTIGNPAPPSNPTPPKTNPSPPKSSGGSTTIQGSGSGSVQNPTTTTPIQNDTGSSSDTQDSSDGFLNSDTGNTDSSSNNSGSNNTATLSSKPSAKHSGAGLWVSLGLLVLVGGVVFFIWRRRQGAGAAAYEELPLPASAPPLPPVNDSVPTAYEEKINETFYPVLHTQHAAHPEASQRADEPPDMFELAREHPETYGNDYLPPNGSEQAAGFTPAPLPPTPPVEPPLPALPPEHPHPTAHAPAKAATHTSKPADKSHKKPPADDDGPTLVIHHNR